jgi:hypothetical protein
VAPHLGDGEGRREHLRGRRFAAQRGMRAHRIPARRRHAGAPGSEVSPGRLLQDQLVPRDPPPLGAAAGSPAPAPSGVPDPISGPVFLLPAVVGHLGDPNRAYRLHCRCTLAGQHINLAQLGDNLLAWKTFSARSRPILVTGRAFPFNDDAPYHADPALPERWASTPSQLCGRLDGVRAEPAVVGLLGTSGG